VILQVIANFAVARISNKKIAERANAFVAIPRAYMLASPNKIANHGAFKEKRWC